MENIQQQIFDNISKCSTAELKAILTSYNGKVDFYDENGELKMQARAAQN